MASVWLPPVPSGLRAGGRPSWLSLVVPSAVAPGKDGLPSCSARLLAEPLGMCVVAHTGLMFQKRPKARAALLHLLAFSFLLESHH